MAKEITRWLEAERGQLAALLDEKARARLRKFIRRQSPDPRA